MSNKVIKFVGYHGTKKYNVINRICEKNNIDMVIQKRYINFDKYYKGKKIVPQQFLIVILRALRIVI
ncbi:hypothetical protein [Caloranaerobacter azorensis]|uniref:hypothetical protein n=1 Tax=Caloranaerobacter azorensis TaxID=116090 RepID=UPI0012E08F97|nr:hypothetical protein [Caloranaerobacter azorensis]